MASPSSSLAFARSPAVRPRSPGSTTRGSFRRAAARLVARSTRRERGTRASRPRPTPRGGPPAPAASDERIAANLMLRLVLRRGVAQEVLVAVGHEGSPLEVLGGTCRLELCDA